MNANNHQAKNSSISSVPSLKANWIQQLKAEHLIAGISGGITSTLVLHPLDLLKVRLAGNSFN